MNKVTITYLSKDRKQIYLTELPKDTKTLVAQMRLWDISPKKDKTGSYFILDDFKEAENRMDGGLRLNSGSYERYTRQIDEIERYTETRPDLIIIKMHRQVTHRLGKILTWHKRTFSIKPFCNIGNNRAYTREILQSLNDFMAETLRNSSNNNIIVNAVKIALEHKPQPNGVYSLDIEIAP